jgi:prolipoprotein diacylglyceryltransferase
VAWAVVGATGSGAVLPALAALSVAYAVGEGVGRMACLSFGCCYGRPVDTLPEPWRGLFGKWHVVFEGPTKKAAYAHNLCGRRLVPVQLMTAVLYCGAACLGMAFFAAGRFSAAMILPLVTTQVWRVVSEFFRADYRGERKISAYQIMAGLGVLYGLVPALALDAPGLEADLGRGAAALWSVPVLLLLQGVFVAVFLYTGRSSVTDSSVCFAVRAGEI